MQKKINSALSTWCLTMDDETKAEMVKFVAMLADRNIHMLPTTTTTEGIMEYIYSNDQDIILESLYAFRYYLAVNEINDADIKNVCSINTELSKSKLFTKDLVKLMTPEDGYEDDILYAILFTIRININFILNKFKGE